MATQTPPATPSRARLHGLAEQGLAPTGAVHWNQMPAELVEAAIRRGEGQLADMGPFVAVTTPFTGRSPKDKFVVREPGSEAHVDWGAVNQPISPAQFELLLADVKGYLDVQSELFVQDLYCGADPAHRLSVRYVTPNAWHASFVRNMFIRPEPAQLSTFAATFSVLHAPEFKADPTKHGTRTDTFIVLNLATRTILIGGTRYAGELKKSMFTVMNYYLPLNGVMPMHCSANTGPDGDTALFFGLSGTGKTTLSADPLRALVKTRSGPSGAGPGSRTGDQSTSARQSPPSHGSQSSSTARAASSSSSLTRTNEERGPRRTRTSSATRIGQSGSSAGRAASCSACRRPASSMR